MQWGCIAQANSLQVDSKYWGSFSLQEFRRALHDMDGSTYVVVNFHRKGVSVRNHLLCIFLFRLQKTFGVLPVNSADR